MENLLKWNRKEEKLYDEDCLRKQSEMRQKICVIYIPGRGLVWEYFKISVKTIRRETQQIIKQKTWTIISFYK